MRVYTLSDMRSKKKLRVYTASEAKGLKTDFVKQEASADHCAFPCMASNDLNYVIMPYISLNQIYFIGKVQHW